MKAKIIFVYNEKGGTGKSTLAMQLVGLFLRNNLTVGVLDLDTGQKTVFRFFENRQKTKESENIPLPMPLIFPFKGEEDISSLASNLPLWIQQTDILLIDAPGTYQPWAMPLMEQADVLVTPFNDSLVDLDPLADIDLKAQRMRRPGPLAEHIWSARQKRMLAKRPPLKWLAGRNRVPALRNKNKELMDILMKDLSKRLSFEIFSNITERVIYRELFLKGLTLMDLKQEGVPYPLSLSAATGRQEIRSLAQKILAP